jgi:histone deacetylase complex regulatory component SIN3
MSLQGRGLDPSNLVSQAQSGFARHDTFEERRQTWSQAPEDSLLHQQDQRGLALQGGSNASNGAVRAVSPTRDPAGADAKRGGPVEFNHAISYVNKIKVRQTRAAVIRLPHGWSRDHRLSTTCQ